MGDTDLYVCTNEFTAGGRTYYCGEVWMFGLLCHVTEAVETARQAREDAVNYAIN